MERENSINITAENPAEMEQVAIRLLAHAGQRRCFLLYGEIGAGKTTLVKAICRQLGVEQAATSPTFSLVNEYTYPAEGKQAVVFHIDLYRLKSLQEAIDIGIEDYLYQPAYCFIEWPELVEDIVPEDAVKIYIQISEHSGRKILFL